MSEPVQDEQSETATQNAAPSETVEKPNTDDVKKAKAEAARMAKALSDLQKKAQELEDFKKNAEREKMSAEERIKAEKEDLALQLKQHQENLAAARTELEQERLINKLIANGLDDPDFGSLIIKNFNAEDEAFEDFVGRMKTSKKFGRFFKGEQKAEAPEQPRPTAPTAPNSGSQRSNRAADEVSEADKRLAEDRYPKDKAKQATFLKNLVEARRIRKQNEVDYGRG